MLWKDVPPEIKQWCNSLWKDHFECVRVGIDTRDLLAWIPNKGTLVAKYGKWIGQTRSREIVYMNYLFVSPSSRGCGVSQQLIESVAHEACNIWAPGLAFFFEVQNTPLSLKTASYMCKFFYVWIPFLVKSNPPKWKPLTSFRHYISSKPGFVGSYTGWKAYICGEDVIVFDAHDDIVWYSNVSTLCTFDGFKISGAHCRLFSPLGNVTVYAENMYFHTNPTTHYILG